MRTSKLLILLFLTLFCCSKKDKDLVDIDSFLNEGEKINLTKDNKIFNQDRDLIKSVSLSNFHKYKSWNQKNYNSRNFLYPSDFNLTKKSKSLSGKFQNVLLYKDILVTVKSNSEVSIYTKDFKKKISKTIYKRKIRKNYDLKFKSVLFENKLFLADNLGNLHAISLKDLKILWKLELGVPFVSNIKIHKKNIYIINSNSKIFSINTLNGNLNWSFETASKNLKNDNSYQIAIFNDNLIFTNDSGEVYCLDLIKRGIKWSLVFENQIFARNPIIFESTPIVIDEAGTLFVSSNYGFTHSIKVETGSINWSIPLTTIRRLFINGNSVFMIHENRFLVIDKSKGTILYNKSFSSSKKRSELFFKDILINKSGIYLLANNSEAIKVNNKNFNDTQRVKLPNKYEDFLIDNNNIFFKTKNSIIKF